MRPALVVHLVFHPRSDDARALARSVHGALNTDPVVPGLRVPTTFSPHVDGRPPEVVDLDQAERSFVVALADVTLDADDAWCSLIADTYARCEGTVHRCVPVQLADGIYPLDDRLDGVNFVRAFDVAPEARAAVVTRRLVVELCRFLHGDPAGEDDRVDAPTKLFLSHTKMDITREPRVVEQLKSALSADQPIKTWFDSGDIEGGSRFAERIEEGIEDSSLLCVLTDNYASREWCRREVLHAKQLARPIVVVDALTSLETRSFPYLGNLPVLRWNGDPQPAIDLVLAETLRDLHTRAVLDGARRGDDVVFTRPPELLTLAPLDEGATVLYPDPPIGTEETAALGTRIRVTTPTQRLSVDRDLRNVRIALSMSESADIDRFGFDEAHLTGTMLELSRHLLIRGATLVYGGHLGDQGYTTQLTELVRSHNSQPEIEPVELLVNYLGWPLPFDDAVKSRFKRVATLERVPRPDDVDEKLHEDFVASPTTFFPADRSPKHRYAWARGMTEMRTAQNAAVAARVVLGGTIGPTLKRLPDGSLQKRWYASRIPGVLEEILLSATADPPVPVFLLGAFGGVPALVLDLIDGREREDMTWEFHAAAPGAKKMRKRYEKGPGWWDFAEMADFIRDRGLTGLNPLLSEEEHRALVAARHPEQMLEILFAGLGRIS